MDFNVKKQDGHGAACPDVCAEGSLRKHFIQLNDVGAVSSPRKRVDHW